MSLGLRLPVFSWSRMAATKEALVNAVYLLSWLGQNVSRNVLYGAARSVFHTNSLNCSGVFLIRIDSLYCWRWPGGEARYINS